MNATTEARETIRQMLAKRYHGAIEPTEEMIEAVLAGAMVYGNLFSRSHAQAIVNGTSAWSFPNA